MYILCHFGVILINCFRNLIRALFLRHLGCRRGRRLRPGRGVCFLHDGQFRVRVADGQLPVRRFTRAVQHQCPVLQEAGVLDFLPFVRCGRRRVLRIFLRGRRNAGRWFAAVAINRRTLRRRRIEFHLRNATHKEILFVNVLRVI